MIKVTGTTGVATNNHPFILFKKKKGGSNFFFNYIECNIKQVCTWYTIIMQKKGAHTTCVTHLDEWLNAIE